ncbi:TAXI family TRAP transporter solute-binding subunit [Vibrio sagamiensis]|nr:TAXI family TRAP transporter solute-binding subunit [Vibrio sagamiensis]
MELKSFFLLAACGLVLPWSQPIQAKEFITMGTGGVTGIYYPAGAAVCKLINTHRREHSVRCSVESSKGSIENIKRLREGLVDFALVQSDWKHHAYIGDSIFEGEEPFEDIRTLFALHTESFNLIVGKDSGINSIEDLVGKRINLGEEGTVERVDVEMVLDAYGWGKEQFKEVKEIKKTEQSQALCDGYIDAYVEMTGHPSNRIDVVLEGCGAKLISVQGEGVNKLMDEHSYFIPSKVKKNVYPSMTEDINNFGVTSTLITTSSVSDDVVYSMVRSVFEYFDDFKNAHPALKPLKKEDMIAGSLSTPLHPGAIKYYKEVGLLDDKVLETKNKHSVEH